GDAVIFYWKLSPDDPDQSDNARGELVLKACHCCMDLLNNLGTYDIDIPDCATKVLRIHLGIGAGTVYDVHVGGFPGRWEHFIAGDAVNQLSHVLDLAKAGELAMSHQALRWICCILVVDSCDIGDYDKRCVILEGLERARRKSTVPLPPPRANEEVDLWDVVPTHWNVELYKSFMNHSAIYKLQADINQSRIFRFDSGLNELLGISELRQVTTVFIRIGSLRRWDNPALLNDAQHAMSVVQNSLQRYEGSLRQFHVDEKGAVILCFFGLPPLAHENDASFGIKAGLDVCGQFTDYFDDFAIGITTGVVSIGGVGTSVRTEYAVMGDSINMASRLMCHPEAEESILCDERSFNLCGDEFFFETLGEAQVKGKARPIAIFRPTGVRKEGARPTAPKSALVGRKAEQDVLSGELQRHCADPAARLVVVEADGGQGLTTLVTYSQMEARAKNCFAW
ncbi:nucleotide cyclase, partial [Blyttiomyces helicus]